MSNRINPASQSPIAVIGLGCRFPGGAHDPEAYLRFLEASGDGIVAQPTDRWSPELYSDADGSPGRTEVRHGGFLQQDIFSFEPAFFGISPREAASLDPQQRLLLEVTAEAFVDAGLPTGDLAGSPTGVFIGGFTLDSMLGRFSANNQDDIDNHTATSSSMTLLSNRLSYAFDLRGPSMTVDTACSSSLVALHLATEALRRGECSVAVAGGVNVMLLPYYQVVMSKGHFLAPDGRSKTFEADADGYGRGEGAGVVVLKPLAQALADGDRIPAGIRATGINQDGATDGIPMPNPDAQQELIEQTCARGGVDPASVGYVEVHGTGTRAGDPIETGAVGRVYGSGSRRRRPLPIGSVKASIGHLEAAAGVAGLIKAILAVRERKILPHRPLRRPNPEIPFQALGLRVPQELEPWPMAGPARAAINSFGYGGTNAHVIVEGPPEAGRRATAKWSGLLPLAARSAEGLAGLAAALLPLATDLALGDLAGALAHRFSHEGVRAAVVAEEAEEVRAALTALAAGEDHPSLVRASAQKAGVVWVFTGMGPQWWAMGMELYQGEPVFKAAVDEADALFRSIGGRSILAELQVGETHSRIARNDVAQPANLLVQVGLVALLRSWGHSPDAILGHSVGEVAAAWAAGCLSLEEAVTVSVHRSSLQQRAAGKGGMLAVGLDRSEVGALIEGLDVVMAADNAPGLVTLAGPHEALTLAGWRAEAQGVFAKGVRVEVPYHSPAMDPLREEMMAALAGLRPVAPAVPLYSTMLGAKVDEAVHGADYWWRNTRQAVLLRDATDAAADDGHDTFLEVGPHAVLGMAIQATLSTRSIKATTLSCLLRGKPEGRTLRMAVAGLWVRGIAPDWTVMAPEGRWVSLPLPAWQRGHHWAESTGARQLRIGRPQAHPLLRQADPGAQPAWTTRLAGPRLAFLREHVVDGAAVMPGAATIEACLAAAAELGELASVEELHFERALVLEEGAGVDLRLRVEDGGIEVHGRARRSGEEATWVRHATGRLVRGARYRQPEALDLAEVRARFTTEVDVAAFYETLDARGLSYGPTFRGVQRLWREGTQVLAELSIPTEDGADPWTLHPAMLDAAFQCLVAAADAAPGTTVLPVGVRRVTARGPLGCTALALGRLVEVAPGAWEGDVQLCDAEGAVVAEVKGLRCEAALVRGEGRGWLHATEWVDLDGLPETSDETPIFVLGDGPVALALRAALGHRHQASAPKRVVCVEPCADRDLLAPTLDLLAVLQQGELEQLIVLTTQGTAVLPGEAVDPSVAAVHGLVRVAMTELPALRPCLVDVDAEVAEADLLALIDAAGSEERALRGGRLLGRRLQRVADGSHLPAPLPLRHFVVGTPPAALEVGQAGRLDSLGFREIRRQAPAAGQVEIEVDAASLNFKDVMKAMGMLGDAALENAYLGRGLGLEAAGRISRVGPGVADLAVGDAVFTYVGGAIRSHLSVDQRFVVRRPEILDATDGASIFVFLTAWYALVHAGRLQAGETVLIHSAAGGVGMAAVQIARLCGARVLATAGTKEKRAMLTELGIAHVFDSRTLDFADEVRAVTDGRGVDVVLNALAGAALVKSLDLVASGGRFLELGKQDLAGDTRLGLRPFNRSISMHAIDLDRMATERPAWFAPVATEVMEAFARGDLKPLPTQVYSADRVVDAFRDLASGDRIGKVVLDLKAGEVALRPALAAPIGGTWLVTGGLGGFGLRTAAWLANHGVQRLVLASRRGVVEPGEASIVEAIQASGVEVRQLALDITDPAAVQATVDGLPDLTGVAHAAMVLADMPLNELDPAAVERAMGAKARGAMNLHRATADRSLDHFLLFGSISAQVGNPGQAAYAAANAALDGLAWHRAAQGLPATCVSWGALGEAGVVARDEGTRVHLQSLGLQPMRPALALDRLGAALTSASPVFTVVDIDWDRWARAVPGTGWDRLSDLLRAEGEGGGSALASLSPEARLVAVTQAVAEAAAGVFRMEVGAMDLSRSLRDQGLDSILAVELGLALFEKLGVELSAMDLLGGRGVGALAEEALRRLALDAPAEEVAAEPGVEGLLDRILVSQPYLSLEDLSLAGDKVLASVVPDLVFGAERTPVAAAEVGRHLAIIGSLACARAWPRAGRHAWPVATSTLEVEPGAPAPAGTRFLIEARCVSVAALQGRAEAEAVMRTEGGKIVGRLRVGYHVIPVEAFRSMFADHARPTDETVSSPYGAAPARPVGQWDGQSFRRLLPPVTVAECAGHFPGLPALPVSILGRHVLAAVLDGRAAAGMPAKAVVVRRAELRTERFAWTGDQLELVTWPQADGEGWACEIRLPAEDAVVASFVLHVEEQAEARALPPVGQRRQAPTIRLD